MLETRRVTHLWIQALPSPDIGRQRVFTACLWKLHRVLADPPAAPVRTLAESVLQLVWKGNRWKGANGEASLELVSFGFWILVELRIAPPPSPDRGAPIRFPKLLKHTFLKASLSPRCFFAVAPGLWILDSGLGMVHSSLPLWTPDSGLRTPLSGLWTRQARRAPKSGLRTPDSGICFKNRLYVVLRTLKLRNLFQP